MLTQINLRDLMAAIKAQTEQSGLPVYDRVPDNAESPLIYMQLVAQRPADTKTMYCSEYEVWLHVIAEETPSSVPMFGHIQKVQEALTEDITLPAQFELVLQTNNGVQYTAVDPSGESHAVLSYMFKIAYGFKCKQ